MNCEVCGINVDSGKMCEVVKAPIDLCDIHVLKNCEHDAQL